MGQQHEATAVSLQPQTQFILQGQLLWSSASFHLHKTNGEEVKVVSKSGVDNLTDLYSDQEEADTRLVFHAIHAAESHSRVIIRCDDTDVLVLLVYYSSKGMFGSSTVLLHSGHGPRERFVPVCAVAKKLGAEFCACLPACHALTGCDTTSSLYRIGKATAFLIDSRPI